MCYISTKIKKSRIQNKGFGFTATQNIKKGEILIKDIPFTINTNTIYSEVCELIYEVLISDKITDFMKLQPKTLDNYNIDKNKVFEELDKVKQNNKNIYDFLIINYTKNEILLFCAKYMCNAFDYKNKSSFLFTATLLNHSCIPNTIFGIVDDIFIFQAIRNIKVGEEITDNYIDITSSKKVRQKHLLDQYGFVCNCERCCEECSRDSEKHDNLAKNIEKERFDTFGFTKAKI